MVGGDLRGQFGDAGHSAPGRIDIQQQGVNLWIGGEGIERIVEIELNAEEQAMFDKSVAAVEGLKQAVADIRAKK